MIHDDWGANNTHWSLNTPKYHINTPKSDSSACSLEHRALTRHWDRHMCTGAPPLRCCKLPHRSGGYMGRSGTRSMHVLAFERVIWALGWHGGMGCVLDVLDPSAASRAYGPLAATTAPPASAAAPNHPWRLSTTPASTQGRWDGGGRVGRWLSCMHRMCVQLGGRRVILSYIGGGAGSNESRHLTSW